MLKEGCRRYVFMLEFIFTDMFGLRKKIDSCPPDVCFLLEAFIKPL